MCSMSGFVTTMCAFDRMAFRASCGVSPSPPHPRVGVLDDGVKDGQVVPQGQATPGPPGCALAKGLARGRGCRHHKTLPGFGQVISRSLMRVELIQPASVKVFDQFGRKIGRKGSEAAGGGRVVPKRHDYGVGSERFLNLQPLEDPDEPPGPAGGSERRPRTRAAGP